MSASIIHRKESQDRWRVIVGAIRALCLFLLPLPVWAQTLYNVDYSTLPGNRLQVDLKFSQPVREPKSFTIDNPARIALDFPGAKVGLTEKSQNIGIGVVDTLSAVEGANRTRVVFNLVHLVPYQVNVLGNVVRVSLGTGKELVDTVGDRALEPGVAPDAPRQERLSTQETPEAAAPAAILSQVPSLQAIDFRRGEKGEGLVLIKLSSPLINARYRKAGQEVIVTFPQTALPEELNRRLDVVDFGTPVTEIDTQPEREDVVMKLTMGSLDYDYLAYQSDTDMAIEVKPVTQAEKEEQDRKKLRYTGERISLNFQDIEVRAILQLLADFTGLNLVTSDTVTGNVTLRLKNVPWDQAMDIILQSKGLGIREEGNVIMVAPQEEIAARERLELETEQQIEELAPLITEYIRINYASAGDLAGLISGEGEASLLSPRGTTSVDGRTNTLIVKDTAANLEAIKRLILELDIPIRQVLIEARIVSASRNFAKDIGIRFGVSYGDLSDGLDNVTISGAQPGTVDPGEVEVSRVTPDGDIETEEIDGCTNLLCIDDNLPYIVSLPTTLEGSPASLYLSVGKVASWLLQLELSALLSEGRGEEIANPKVITVNQGDAIIETGTQIPYQEASASGATSVSFQDAVLRLEVTPQITPDNRVLLDLEVNQDTVGDLTVLGTPVINTNRLETQVLVDNGETVVLGGVFTDRSQDDVNRIPFFSELPYVGFLFRKKAITSMENELLIFVTPRILEEGF